MEASIYVCRLKAKEQRGLKIPVGRSVVAKIVNPAPLSDVPETIYDADAVCVLSGGTKSPTISATG